MAHVKTVKRAERIVRATGRAGWIAARLAVARRRRDSTVQTQQNARHLPVSRTWPPDVERAGSP